MKESPHLEDLVTSFGKINDLTKVKTVVIDKDCSEISAIKKVVSNASLQICKSHVEQPFAREIKKSPIGQEERQKVMQPVKQLIFAKSENMYTKVYGKFTEVAPPHLINYHMKNWEESKDYGVPSRQTQSRIWATNLESGQHNK